MRRQESGQALVLFLAGFALMVSCWATLLVIGLRTVRRIHAQDTADAVALSVAVMRSRALNRVGMINALMGSMMFRVEGPVAKLIRFSQGALTLDPESAGELEALPDRFWLVYNPLIPSAQVLKTLFEGLITLRTLYVQWGSGAQLEFVRRVAAANGMAWKVGAQLTESFVNPPQTLQPLQWDSVPIFYFSSRAGLPFVPIKKGKKGGDLVWLRDRRAPWPYTVVVQTARGDLFAVAAARPFNRSGPMFPVYGEPLSTGGNRGVVGGGAFSWLGGVSRSLQRAADRLGVSWGVAATLDYFQAKDGGWDGQLVPISRIKNVKVSHVLVETNND